MSAADSSVSRDASHKAAALAAGLKTSRDTTFLSYSDEQAKAYAQGRGVSSTYPPELYDIVLKHHVETGGKLDLLLDVGCGPGNSTRDMATRFARVIGTDGSPGMINEAKKLGGATGAPDQPIEWAVSEAEHIASVDGLDGNVDLITVAMAAHWFDMPKFWEAAAKVLRRGGSVAVWTCSSYFAHPSMPQAKQMQALLTKLEDEILGPYATPGNWMSRNMYRDLLLPWTSSPEVAGFTQTDYLRKEWNENGKCDPSEPFFMGDDHHKPEDLKKGFQTASMYTRWLEANKADVEAGKKRDCLDELQEEIIALVDPTLPLRMGPAGVLIIVKKA